MKIYTTQILTMLFATLLIFSATASAQEPSNLAKSFCDKLEKEYYPDLKARKENLEKNRATVSTKECDDYLTALNATVAVWNSIPKSEYKKSRIVEAGKPLDEYLAFGKTAQAIFKERKVEEDKQAAEKAKVAAANAESDKANEALFAEWRTASEPYAKAVGTLLNSGGYVTRYQMNIGGGGDRYEIDEKTMSQLLKEADEGEKMMSGKFAALRDLNDSRYRDLLYKPSIWREVLAERKKIANAAVAAKIMEGLNNELSLINIDLLLKETGKLSSTREEQLERIAEFKKTVQPKLKALGMSESDMGFDKINAKIDAYWKTVDSLAPFIKFPEDGKYKDAASEQAMSAWVNTYHKGKAKILKTAMSYDDWAIEKNNLGIPLHREKRGYVLYTLPGSKWNILEKTQVRQTYTGGGKYSASKGFPGGLSARYFYYTASKN
jgi:hypothetical protein